MTGIKKYWIIEKNTWLYGDEFGQLSAVALSFLLCMNQAYGANKACSILLIDDPVKLLMM